MLPSIRSVLFIFAFLRRPTIAVDCWSTQKNVDPQDCQRVMADIVYQPDGTLDRASGLIHEVKGNCSLIIQNRKKATVTKEQIQTTMNRILEKCESHAGNTFVKEAASVYVEIWDHSWLGLGAKVEFDPIGLPVCGLNNNAPDITPSDCEAAYKQFPVDDSGNLLSLQRTSNTSIEATQDSCTVVITTTDESVIQVTRAEVDGAFKKMVQTCQSESGLVNVQGGTSGNNGHIIVRMRHQSPCLKSTASKERIKQECI